MNSTPLPVDITNITNRRDFLRLVEELNRTHIPRAIMQENKTVAVLLPVETTEYSDEKPDREEVLALAGSWGERDWEQVEKELDAIRHASPPTPPLELPL